MKQDMHHATIHNATKLMAVHVQAMKRHQANHCLGPLLSLGLVRQSRPTTPHGPCGSWPMNAMHQLGPLQRSLVVGRLMSTHLLFHLQLLDDGSQLGQDVVGLLVVFELGGDEFGEVAEWLGGVEDLVGG